MLGVGAPHIPKALEMHTAKCLQLALAERCIVHREPKPQKKIIKT